jgi:hypothetical protein
MIQVADGGFVEADMTRCSQMEMGMGDRQTWQEQVRLHSLQRRLQVEMGRSVEQDRS